MDARYGLRPFQRHSMVLTVGGLIYILYGLVIMRTWKPDGPRADAIRAGVDIFPLEVWGWMWVIVGVLSVLSARWPAYLDKWGYAVLTGFSAGWAAVYLAGLFFENNTLAESGGAIVWMLVSFLWWAIAGLMNPDRVVVIEVEVPTNGAG